MEKQCDSWDDFCYFTEDDNCISINYCSKGDYNKC